MGELVERVDEQDRVLGVVDRSEAIRHGWLHRVATIICRDTEGRVLVHRSPRTASRFPGEYNWLRRWAFVPDSREMFIRYPALAERPPLG